jgi:uncharacterized protein (TIGR02246 family)
MRGFLLALGLALALGTGAARADTRAEIDAANQKFVATFAKGDAAAVAALYTTKATLLPPGAPAAAGRPAIEAFWAEAIKAGLKNVSLQAQSVDTYGRATAREIGRFGFDAPDGSRVEGKYVVIWRKSGKTWRLDTDIWNMDK